MYSIYFYQGTPTNHCFQRATAHTSLGVQISAPERKNVSIGCFLVSLLGLVGIFAFIRVWSAPASHTECPETTLPIKQEYLHMERSSVFSKSVSQSLRRVINELYNVYNTCGEYLQPVGP